MYMATWWIGLPKNIRPPGCTAPRDTRVVPLYCMPELCGSETPAAAQAALVSPEQS